MATQIKLKHKKHPLNERAATDGERSSRLDRATYPGSESCHERDTAALERFHILSVGFSILSNSEVSNTRL